MFSLVAKERAPGRNVSVHAVFVMQVVIFFYANHRYIINSFFSYFVEPMTQLRSAGMGSNLNNYLYFFGKVWKNMWVNSTLISCIYFVVKSLHRKSVGMYEYPNYILCHTGMQRY